MNGDPPNCPTAHQCVNLFQQAAVVGATVSVRASNLVITSNSEGAASSIAVDSDASGSIALALFSNPVVTNGLDATTENLVVRVDGNAVQTIILNGDCNTAEQCVDVVGSVEGATVTASGGGALSITSDSTGASSSVNIAQLTGANARALFGNPSSATIRGMDRTAEDLVLTVSFANT